jgi:L-asparaginase
MARIALIGCGGTISSLAETNTDYIDYPETGRKITAEEVLDFCPGLKKLAQPTVLTFRAVGSSAIGPGDWLQLAHLIETTANAPDAPDGFVILHGTATLEETAYFLHLVLKVDIPVVLTGAQRPLNVIGSDAEANLRAAFRVAGDPRIRGMGVLVVMNDAIWPAREVTKTSTHRLQAFTAPAAAQIGTIDMDQISISFEPCRPHTMATPFSARISVADMPRVDVLYAVAGGDDAFARAAIAAGSKGIVSAGFAPGMPPPLERSTLVEAGNAGVVVVQSSRVGSGRVAKRGWLKDQGWISSNDLNPQKARILLMLALTVSDDLEWVQDCFDKF